MAIHPVAETIAVFRCKTVHYTEHPTHQQLLAMAAHLSPLLTAYVIACLTQLGRTSDNDFGLVNPGTGGMVPIIFRKFGEQITLNVALLLMAVFFVYGLGCWTGAMCAQCGKALVRPEEPTGQKTKATQSPTTYTWKSTAPRFTPLQAYGHGAWDV